MKIKECRSGEYYQLKPGTELEIERTNLFFNEYGEQSLPLSLPATAHNLRIAGYPTELANIQRPPLNLECIIQDGDTVLHARQVILGATAKDGIETVFYLNEGCFLNRMKDITLHEVFGTETVNGYTSLAQCKSFCLTLLTEPDERLTLFPISVDDGEYEVQTPLGPDTFKLMELNEFNHITNTFERWGQTTIKKNGTNITLPEGIYITPFVKVNYILNRIFGHMGYTLLGNFFTQTPPFDTLCVLNTTCDTLLNGVIRFSDLLPDVTCDEFLEAFRRKFMCEFVPNESENTVSIVLMRDLLEKPVSLDLTPYLCDNLEIEYPEERKRITLTGGYIETSVESPRANNQEELSAKAPNYYMLDAGCFIRDQCIYYQSKETEGVSKSWWSAAGNVMGAVVSASSTPYDAGGDIETVGIDVPEVQPEFRHKYTGAAAGQWWLFGDEILCAGKARYKNSVLVKDGQTIEDAKKENTNTDDGRTLPVLFAIEEMGLNGQKDGRIEAKGYSLSYNGENGTYEKFYRKFDELYRNSLYKVRVKLLLPAGMVGRINVHDVVMVNGQRMLWNNLQYTIGGKKEVVAELLTTRNYEPISRTEPFKPARRVGDYDWVAKCSTTFVSEAEYNAAKDKDLKRVVVGIDKEPTKELFLSQEKCFQRSWYCHDGATAHTRLDFWAVVEQRTTV